MLESDPSFLKCMTEPLEERGVTGGAYGSGGTKAGDVEDGDAEGEDVEGEDVDGEDVGGGCGEGFEGI
jgi:hypothetical protein